MNILFVLYHDFSTASAIHVHNFANSLADNGHNVAVNVPCNKNEIGNYLSEPIKYSTYDFSESMSDTPFLSKIGAIDIIHAWTPREVVRKQTLSLKSKFPGVKIIVHLEDNEERIVEAYTGMPFSQLERVPKANLDYIIPEPLSFPHRYKEFLNCADGVTVIVDELLDFLPRKTASHRLWPIIDIEFYHPDVSGYAIRQKHNISDEEIVLCYVGSVHGVNAEEVKSLYLSVALANRQGIPTRLLRAGRDTVDFLDDLRSLVIPYVVEVGYVEMEVVPQLMAAADILIQPGCVDTFNKYRLPSKVPEFLAMGKPVATPAANLGLHLQDRHNAFIMNPGNAENIFKVIREISSNGALAEAVGKEGRNFAEKKFNSERITKGLIGFYTKVINSES